MIDIKKMSYADLIKTRDYLASASDGRRTWWRKARVNAEISARDNNIEDAARNLERLEMPVAAMIVRGVAAKIASR